LNGACHHITEAYGNRNLSTDFSISSFLTLLFGGFICGKKIREMHNLNFENEISQHKLIFSIVFKINHITTPQPTKQRLRITFETGFISAFFMYIILLQRSVLRELRC
jgi:hypothetical protein